MKGILIMVGAVFAVPALVKLYGEVQSMVAARRPYADEVRKAANKHNVGYHVLSALLYRESNFNPDAVGGYGEVGMGQMTGPAATDVGTTLTALRSSPDLQIDKAAQYLRLMILGAGDLLTGVRAYNAGLTGAKRDTSRSMDYAGKILLLAGADFLMGGLTGGAA